LIATRFLAQIDQSISGDNRPGVSGGVRDHEGERGKAVVGRQHVGLGGTAPGGTVRTGFETNSEFKCFKQISNYFKLWSIRKVLSRTRKIEIKYDFEDLREMNNSL
jgi:hypothetical protein